MQTDDPLRTVLAPGETVLWSTERPRQRPGIGGLIGGVLVLLFASTILSAVLANIWGAVAGGSGSSPFGGFVGAWPIAFVLCLLALSLTLGRRLLGGVPPQLLLVTDRRALVAERRGDGFRIVDEQPRDTLTHLTRVRECDRTDLLWRVRVTSRSNSDSGSGKSYHRHGFRRLADAEPAEAALLDPQRLAEAPDAGQQLSLVPADEQRLLSEVLLPGERVTWCERAQASELQRRWAPIVMAGFIIGLLLVIYAIAFLVLRAVRPGEGFPLPLIIMGVVFAGFIALMVVGMYRELRVRGMDDAAYEVTQLRALTAMRAEDGTLLVNSFLPAAVAGNERPDPGREGADFEFGEKTPLPLRFLIEQDGFHRVRDAAGASAALMRLTHRR
ncbi:hypothetical protein HJ590_14025 [Naumannella sp. ID2617S]|nr:hypothetical protein [Naumannella sp. ID2617S]